jgi:Na+-driven multidrug efflux pump
MNETKREFWRGYFPLLVAIAAARLAQQVDMLMIGRLGGGAAGAYVVLTRLAIIDIVLTAAMGAVASTIVARARRDGETAKTIGQILGLAVLFGLCSCALGLSLYPSAARWLAGDGEVAELIGKGVIWFSLAAPFRFFSGVAAFVLHALGRGGLVVKWKLLETAVKAAGNFLAMEVFGLGFSGCFIASLIIGAASSFWCARTLSLPQGHAVSIPGLSWTLGFLRSTAWEAQRMIAVHLATLVGLALFAAPWLGKYDVSRLNSFAAGQTFMLILFAPFVAMTQFLAFRLAARGDDRAGAFRAIWSRGLPVAMGCAALLFASSDWLGRLYGQSGPWWTTLIEALAISLPLRFGGNVMRAVLQARGAFGVVAVADSAVFWLLATPLIAIGLYADAPSLAYSALVVPEAACAMWMLHRLQLSSFPGAASAYASLLRCAPPANARTEPAQRG